MTTYTERYLQILFDEAKKVKTILELGIYGGISTRGLLLGCKEGKQGHLISIDRGEHQTTHVIVENIKQSEFSKYFTWMKTEFFDIPLMNGLKPTQWI